jgi:hypothetical protein
MSRSTEQEDQPMSSSSTSIIWIGMDVHKDTVMVAVFRDQRSEPEVVQQLPNDPRKLRRFFERWARSW